jgi:hypothetical protein
MLPASTEGTSEGRTAMHNQTVRTANHKVATPVNWEPGEDVIIAGSVSDEDARKAYPQGWHAPRPYIRIVPQPQACTTWNEPRITRTALPA